MAAATIGPANEFPLAKPGNSAGEDIELVVLPRHGVVPADPVAGRHMFRLG